MSKCPKDIRNGGGGWSVTTFLWKEWRNGQNIYMCVALLHLNLSKESVNQTPYYLNDPLKREAIKSPGRPVRCPSLSTTKYGKI